MEYPMNLLNTSSISGTYSISSLDYHRVDTSQLGSKLEVWIPIHGHCWASCQGYMDPKRYTAWWFQSLWKILVNWDDDSQYMEKQKKCSKPPTSMYKNLGTWYPSEPPNMNGVDFASYISCITIFAIFESLNQYFACLYHHLDDWITRLPFLMVKSNLSWFNQRFHLLSHNIILG